MESAYRYLGHGARSAELDALIASCISELKQNTAPKHLYRLLDAEKFSQELCFGGTGESSCGLLNRPGGCNRAIVFAATLGAEADRLIGRYGVTNISRAAVLQACASAQLREYCEECAKHILAEQGPDKTIPLRWHYPGCDGMSISLQQRILDMLECWRIGIVATDGMLLVPSKSVTAVIEITAAGDAAEGSSPCGHCSKTDCDYRRV